MLFCLTTYLKEQCSRRTLIEKLINVLVICLNDNFCSYMSCVIKGV